MGCKSCSSAKHIEEEDNKADLEPEPEPKKEEIVYKIIPRRIQTPGRPIVRIATLNICSPTTIKVNGRPESNADAWRERNNKILKALESVDADIFCIQGMWGNPNLLNLYKTALSGFDFKYVRYHHRTDGVGLFVGKRVKMIDSVDGFFDGRHPRGYIVSEVEVDGVKDLEKLVALGKDVTDDPRYKNKNLAR